MHSRIKLWFSDRVDVLVVGLSMSFFWLTVLTVYYSPRLLLGCLGKAAPVLYTSCGVFLYHHCAFVLERGFREGEGWGNAAAPGGWEEGEDVVFLWPGCLGGLVSMITELP